MDYALYWFVVCVVGIRVIVFGRAAFREPDKYPGRFHAWSERRFGSGRLPPDPFRFRPGAYTAYYRWWAAPVMLLGAALVAVAVNGALREVFG